MKRSLEMPIANLFDFLPDCMIEARAAALDYALHQDWNFDDGRTRQPVRDS